MFCDKYTVYKVVKPGRIIRVNVKPIRTSCTRVAHVTSALLLRRQIRAGLVGVTGTLVTGIIVVLAVSACDHKT